MTPREENEILAQWAGLECQCEIYYSLSDDSEPTLYWENCPRHSNGGLPPDYDRDEVAVNLLPLLRSKGYTWVMQDFPTHGGYQLQIGRMGRFPMSQANAPTIAAAIKAAIKRLLEKENTQ